MQKEKLETQSQSEQFVILTFRVRREFKDMMNEIREAKKGGSLAEVFRDAVFSLHRKVKPPYLEPSPYMKEKSAQIDDEQRLAELTDDQWASEVLKALVVDGKKQSDKVTPERYCLTHGLSRSVQVVELSQARKYFTQIAPDLMDYHLKVLTTMSVEELLAEDYWKRELWRLYRIGSDPVVTAPENHILNDPPTEADIRELQEESEPDESVDEEDNESLV